MNRILAAAAILLSMTSTAFSDRLNLTCTDNPDLIYDGTTGNVKLLPTPGSAKNKIIGFVFANATGVFRTEPDAVFTARTPWNDAVYDNLPKQIGSSDIGGIGTTEGTGIDLGNIFPTGLRSKQELFDLLSQADVLWKRGAGGEGALDFGNFCIPEPSTSLLGFIGAATLLAHKRRRQGRR
ncbi:MAG: PEP-CTERM sorting domain-containing protein [Pirellulales bacterium]